MQHQSFVWWWTRWTLENSAHAFLRVVSYLIARDREGCVDYAPRGAAGLVVGFLLIFGLRRYGLKRDLNLHLHLRVESCLTEECRLHSKRGDDLLPPSTSPPHMRPQVGVQRSGVSRPGLGT